MTGTKIFTRWFVVVAACAFPLSAGLGFCLVFLQLWYSEPFGGESAAQCGELPIGAMRLLWTFGPMVGVFLWVSVMGLVFAGTPRRPAAHRLAGLLAAWPLLNWALAFALRSEAVLFYLPLLGTVLSMTFCLWETERRTTRLGFLPVAVNVLWPAFQRWYFYEWFSVFGD